MPDDWIIFPPDGTTTRTLLKAATGNVATHKAVTLTICPVPSQITPEMMPAFGPSVRKVIEDGLIKEGAKITGHDYQKIGDYEFNILSISHEYPVGTLYSSCWITFVGGNMYQIVVVNLNGDPLKEPDLLAVVKSFSTPQK